MKKQLAKLTLTATLALAITLTFTACEEKQAAKTEVNKGSFIDTRDNKTYKIVKIGEQIWMAENLNFEAKGSMCYDNDTANCQKYGRLYNWETAMKACPGDWHLPNEKEWKILVDFLGGEKIAGKKLKAESGWNNNGNGEDKYGFSALPGGNSNTKGNFNYVGNNGYWWSFVSGGINQYVAYIDMRHDDEYVHTDNYDDGNLLSVRCVQEPGAAKAATQEEATQEAVAEKPAENAGVGSFTDERDNKTYKTVKIGEQVWMAENLNIEIGNSQCYDCQKYGRLYDLATAMKACPSGWHLPSKAEWDKLIEVAGGEDSAGKYLKAKSGWNDSGNGEDKFGFSALPGGKYDGCEGDCGGGLVGVGYSGCWWAATANYRLYMYDEKEYVDLSEDVNFSEDSESNLYSVRCIQD
jgi:uncharacterized protein (TIGR02145 family)